ncbi:hypothetical protein H0G86_003170 [Trichoderma simmonsii]|uniref:Uncharacterized protein n=1 Tax=Trichoderma simmonsii TaxID=1491479 RepID=A0A8G0LA40_9HYPO|nr:hypothetical protein H0G86_003170 [Trichoderma simmonsii]
MGTDSGIDLFFPFASTVSDALSCRPMTLPFSTVLVTFGFNPFALLFPCSPPKRRPVVRSPFRLKRHLLADSIASHRIVSHCIASAPSAAAGNSADDWPAAPDKRFVRDAGRNWSKGGSVSTARKKGGE